MKVNVRELSAKQIKRIEKRMRPGGEAENASQSGFLARREGLIDVIERDERTLAELKITPEQIGDRLESLISQAYRIINLSLRGRVYLTEREVDSMECRGPGVLVEGKFLVAGVAYCGWQECPFESRQGEPCSDMIGSSVDYWIENIVNGRKIEFPGLAIHLIRAHHFFEGSVEYRVDPVEVTLALELEPGKDYSLISESELVWVYAGSTSEGLERLERDGWSRHWSTNESYEDVYRNPDEIAILDDQICFYLRDDRCVSVARSDHFLERAPIIREAEWECREIPKGVQGWIRRERSYVPAQGYEKP